MCLGCLTRGKHRFLPDVLLLRITLFAGIYTGSGELQSLSEALVTHFETSTYSVFHTEREGGDPGISPLAYFHPPRIYYNVDNALVRNLL